MDIQHQLHQPHFAFSDMNFILHIMHGSLHPSGELLAIHIPEIYSFFPHTPFCLPLIPDTSTDQVIINLPVATLFSDTAYTITNEERNV